MERQKITSGVVTRIGVLSAIAAILYFFPEVPIIGFYKLDFSNLPALLGGFAMGPVAGLVIVFVKDLFGMLHSSSAFVGELADFLCSGAFVVVACAIYRQHKSFMGALWGMALGTLVMGLVGALANYYLMIPFYINQMGFPAKAIVGTFSKVIPAVDSMLKVILLITIPFNLLKGAVMCALCLLLYKRLSGFLHGGKA